MKCNRVLFCILALLAIQTLQADIRLPFLVGDHMVLQRQKPISVWGWADPDEKIQIEFKNKVYHATAGESGKWQVKLDASEAGGPYEMVLKGANQIQLEDILIGDVWVCSGQSNMDLPMRRVRDLYEDEIAHAENNQLRYFTVPLQYDFHGPLEEIKPSQWESTNPTNILHFSATAYFFGKNLVEKYHIPIGLIRSSLGGSPAESWMSGEALEGYPHYLKEMIKFQDQAFVDNIVKSDRDRRNTWQRTLRQKDRGYQAEVSWSQPEVNLSDWPTIQVPSFWSDEGVSLSNGVIWFRKDIDLSENWTGKKARLDLGRIVDSDSVYVNGQLVGTTGYQYPPRIYQVPEGILKAWQNVIVVRVISEIDKGGFIIEKPYRLSTETDTVDLQGLWHYQSGAEMDPLQPQTFVRWKPGGLYNGMIAPLLNLSIKGVLWYQGESNADRASEYQTLFPDMIKDWREHWKQGNFPFVYAQLPNFMEAAEEPGESEWADLRYAQSQALALPNTAMSVNIDLGEWNDIHPLNKKDVGKRLALAAMRVAYQDTVDVTSGPVYKNYELKGNRVLLSFDSVGSGLMSKNGENLNYFAIAGEDGKFVWAKAEIVGNQVAVWHPTITHPQKIRYAWADNPDTANLVNREGLPAGPFEVIIQ